jgi:hypothetical protein
VRQVAVHLLAVIRQQAVRIAALDAHVLELPQLRSSSSSDPPYEKRTVRSDSQGQPGATPGHPGYHRLRLASTEVIEDEEATLFTMEGRQQTGACSNLFVLGGRLFPPAYLAAFLARIAFARLSSSTASEMRWVALSSAA